MAPCRTSWPSQCQWRLEFAYNDITKYFHVLANKFKKNWFSRRGWLRIFGLKNWHWKEPLVTTVNNNKIYGSNMKKMKFLHERISVMMISSHHPFPYERVNFTSSYIKVLPFYVQTAFVLPVALQNSQVVNIFTSFQDSPGFISNQKSWSVQGYRSGKNLVQLHTVF